MMKWGRKGSHSSPSYLINYVFPISWLKKLKRKSGKWKAGTEQENHKAKGNEMTRCSSMPTKWKEGRFYSGTDDPYWRLSFGEDSLEGKKGGEVRSLRYNSDDEFNVPKSNCKRPRSRSWEGDRLRFKETITKKQYKVGNMQEKYQQKGMKTRERRLKAQAGFARKDQEQRSAKSNKRVLKEKKSNINSTCLVKQEGALRSAQKDLNETKQLKTAKIRDELQKSRVVDYTRQWNLLCPSCSAKMSKADCILDDLDVEDANTYPDEQFSSEMQKSAHKKINKIISKNENHRLSIHLSNRVRIKRRKASRKINSPKGRNAGRTECKTRAAELMKKEKRMKRTINDTDIEAESKTAFDRYAVQKCSYDPQQDFRDSMLEMIVGKGIKQAEELDELLVCYLTHNCVDYHDLIIKVFRQVWFELNQVYFEAAW